MRLLRTSLISHELLHPSERQKWNISKAITSVRFFSQSLDQIRYLGKGTYIDCALRKMYEEMDQFPSSPSALRFAVVITDGHVTGSPCRGLKVAAEEARDKGIRIFAVAASSNIDETGLREIASSPATVYRDKFMAVDLSFGARTHEPTINRIIKTMVTPGLRTDQKIHKTSTHVLLFSFVFAETSGICWGETNNIFLMGKFTFICGVPQGSILGPKNL